MSKNTGFEIRRSTSNEFVIDITLKNYDAYYFAADYDSDNNDWEVEFEREGSGIQRVKIDRKVLMELFAALEKAFSEFLKTKKPDSFYFTGSKDRIKLYDTIARRITNKTKYKMSKEPTGPGGTAYFFDKEK